MRRFRVESGEVGARVEGVDMTFNQCMNAGAAAVGVILLLSVYVQCVAEAIRNGCENAVVVIIAAAPVAIFVVAAIGWVVLQLVRYLNLSGES